MAVRERLAFADQTLADELAQLHDPVVEEVVLLSTCNRVEFYLQGPDAAAGARCCIDFLATYHGLPDAQFAPHLYQLHDARGGAASLSGCLQPGFDGAWRAADPRTGEGGVFCGAGGPLEPMSF